MKKIIIALDGLKYSHSSTEHAIYVEQFYAACKCSVAWLNNKPVKVDIKCLC